MSLNVANRVSNKWHNLKSLTVETQSLGPKIYARSPEQNTMMDLTKIQYALSGIWATAPTMPSTDGETDTSKFYMLFEPMPYRNIPKLTKTPDVEVLEEGDNYEIPGMALSFDQYLQKDETKQNSEGIDVNLWEVFQCNFLGIRDLA